MPIVTGLAPARNLGPVPVSRHGDGEEEDQSEWHTVQTSEKEAFLQKWMPLVG
jgi:hypothetical protein